VRDDHDAAWGREEQLVRLPAVLVLLVLLVL
jgi:hypothetical protein